MAEPKYMIHACPQRMWYVEGYLVPSMIAQDIPRDRIRLYYGVKMPYSITAIDGFIAPGHVSVVTGSGVFEELARETGLPFAVAGFEGPGLLAAIGALVKMRGQPRPRRRSEDQ